MPELPEVEVIRQGLAPLVVGRRVEQVFCSGKKLRLPIPMAELQACLSGSRIVSVDRRAKFLILRNDREDLLVIHLGMTGRLGLFPLLPPAPSMIISASCWTMAMRYGSMTLDVSVRCSSFHPRR